MKLVLKRIYNNSKEYILFALLLLLSLSLLSVNSNDKIKSVKTLAFGSFASVNNLLSYPFNYFSLYSQLEQQRMINARLMLENSLLRSEAIENVTLKKMIGYKDTVIYPLAVAKVISKLGSAFKGKFIVDIGREDSIKEGMPVLTEKGLVGIISECAAKFSVVTHLYNSDLRLAVRIRETGTEGILYWNAGDLIIKNIPTTSSIIKGQEVFTSDFSTIFPPYIPVGHVEKIRSRVAGLLSEVEIIPNVKIEEVRNVFVMKLLRNNELMKVKTGD